MDLVKVFKSKTREEWCEIMEGTDVCFSPILSLDEVKDHPHNVARNSFVQIDDILQPAPAPRFSRTKATVPHGSRKPGENSSEILLEAGYTEREILDLLACRAVVQS